MDLVTSLVLVAVLDQVMTIMSAVPLPRLYYANWQGGKVCLDDYPERKNASTPAPRCFCIIDNAIKPYHSRHVT
jgi:hypothetical protein